MTEVPTIHSILSEFRAAADSNRDLGDKFERLIAAFLKTDPQYAELFEQVWLWSEWPLKNKRPDTGIDLVAQERATGDLWAIQCKFFYPAHSLQKADIDSFFTASGKEPFKYRMIVSTTDKWSTNAEEALEHQRTPVTRLRVADLEQSPIDWSKFSLNRPQDIGLQAKFRPLPHQDQALAAVKKGLKAADRGKLIMACGTGKTFTGLKLAEDLVGPRGHVLILVPSISLLSQTLRVWTSQAGVPLHCFAVCSDTKVGARRDPENEDITSYDLAFPATTKADKLAHQLKSFKAKDRMVAVFATYQSIKVVSDAQKKGAPTFDLVIADEAHRTTGVTLEGDEESHFVRVHDQKFLEAKKRLYMTATPRIYTSETKAKADDASALLCSMDDEALYGKELHRLDFSEAVRRGLLSDYKVMVLAVDEKYVSRTFQAQLADGDNELNLEDAVKITGCWNGLSKRLDPISLAEIAEQDTAPMRRAVAFSQSIKASKKITSLFADIIGKYREQHDGDDNWLSCQVEHVDGTFNALARNEKLDWLKEDAPGNTCRILSNARCLAEGVDVPALDAVMFLNPRNSEVDVVQSVGRVMRKAPGKKYGYIILPVGVPADTPPEQALADNKRYKVVWQVLQALRAHDDRFNATVNKLDLNHKRPDNIQVIGVGGGPGDDGDGAPKKAPDGRPVQTAFNFPNLEEWRDAIYARIVVKCGTRKYWESWAKDVARIAERHTTRITTLLEKPKPAHKKAFADYLEGLRENLNPSISESDAIEMLSQHLITKPVFDALFEGYEFTDKNPVSRAMQQVLKVLEGDALSKETEGLERFYESVRERAAGIDNAEAKQAIIKELYEKFFQLAFPKMAERQGIVYTPTQVVDFIIKSTDQALRAEFGVGLTDKGVHILDPFTGTGTFIVRLLQSGLIDKKDLARKYAEELHANELVLLAYYIAAINIEETYHDLSKQPYEEFQGIVLTDTFQAFEAEGTLGEIVFPVNSKRVKRQAKTEIRVIVGNPPYSAKQESENEANKNIKYPTLDGRISSSYAKFSGAVNKNNLYDSYIRAFRWASDRIGKSGVICYVTNGSFIDGNAMDGFRKCLTDEFSAIYCFNLRGNQRTQGERSREEGGKIFGSGSRAPIAITLLVKNPDHTGPCQLHYHDIGDYLNREEKLKIITDFGGYHALPWKTITPNDSHDWINQRDAAFDKFMPIAKDGTSPGLFDRYSRGLETARDTWNYNFSKKILSANVQRMLSVYDSELVKIKKAAKKGPLSVADLDKIVENDPSKIKWSSSLKQDVLRGQEITFTRSGIRTAVYRPFCRQAAYFDRDLNHRVGMMFEAFPKADIKNVAICINGPGSGKQFSAIVVDSLPDLNIQHSGGQVFPLYSFLTKKTSEATLFDDGGAADCNLSGHAIDLFRAQYEKTVVAEDIFYYVYGVFHSPEYQRRFSNDLTKVSPRIPFAKDFWVFSKAGRELAKWHLEYEIVEPYPLKEHIDKLDLGDEDLYRVKKMAFGKSGKTVDKTIIHYNSHITLSGIPLEAYDYVVNGRPAIEWIMERYQITTDKDSGITNDPNDWSEDQRYILDLVKRIVRVSLETMKIVKALPPLNEIKA